MVKMSVKTSVSMNEKMPGKIRVDLNSTAVEMVQLRARHGEIERRLAELDRHLSLTPDEQLERARLKKEKLRAKDRLAELAAHPPS